MCRCKVDATLAVSRSTGDVDDARGCSSHSEAPCVSDAAGLPWQHRAVEAKVGLAVISGRVCNAQRRIGKADDRAVDLQMAESIGL